MAHPEDVAALLAAAGLHDVSAAEVAGYVRLYPTLRAQADGLYLEELRDEVPLVAPAFVGFEP